MKTAYKVPCTRAQKQKARSLEPGSVLEFLFGSPTWARTRDLRINSPSLYRLSYRGIGEARIIGMAPTRVNFDRFERPALPGSSEW